MTEKMNAAMFYAPKDVRFERTDVPSPGPGELLVKVRAALTCGTDIKTYQRGHPVIIPKTPSTFGHEYSGDIVEVGEGVTKFKPGMRVTACNAVPCMNCYFCKLGHNELCEDLLIVNGAYAEYIVVPERMVNVNVYEVPDHISYEEAALAEPLGTAVHALRKCRIDLGDTVAVLGTGPLGLMLIRLAHLQGARVIVSGKGDERLEIAKEFGANDVIDIRDVPDPAERIKMVKEMCNFGYGPDVVVEAAGLPEAWEEAVDMVRPAGKVVFFGGCKSGTSITLDTKLMHYAELTLYGVFHQTPDDYKRAFNLLTSRTVDGRQFVKETRPLDRLIDAFDEVKALKAIKYAVDPTQMN
ncbi:MAG: zinc-binding dehydrogenase [Chloroflexi bacterium]|nr:MAG: zinc-binding dehydrogenase [Chloroflexota bacterium]MBL1193815.1 zinc-binding dehydrogenase [Chloroflexota bacterium]NOH11108.1 zinc-binding dehydrogenase [Chloroflexota bacterium]